jgi:hypothetical protein
MEEIGIPSPEWSRLSRSDDAASLVVNMWTLITWMKIVALGIRRMWWASSVIASWIRLQHKGIFWVQMYNLTVFLALENLQTLFYREIGYLGGQKFISANGKEEK